MSARPAHVLLVLIALSQPSFAQNEPGKLRLVLPQDVYAVVNTETSIYFDNIVLTESPDRYQFKVDCSIGKTESRRWKLTAEPVDIGKHSLSISVRDSSGRMMGKASTQLLVVPAGAGTRERVKLLIVGDSLTHATLYPNELARLLSRPGNPAWSMLGTHRPKNAAEGVAHEGYGGWTWQRFVNKYEPEPDGTHRKRSSPFVYLNATDKPQLDVARYFESHHNGARPDVVFFLLGINDCFSVNPDDSPAVDERIDAMFKQADTLLADFRRAAPDADLVVCITTPPNSRESGFEANYKGRYHRWGWKRIQHRIVERLLNKYQRRKKSGDGTDLRLFVAPTHLNLDPIDGYPENNGVHPNATGYRQIGVSLYSWLKWRLMQ